MGPRAEPDFPMAENLIDSLKSQLTGAVMGQISQQLGLDSSKAGGALSTTAATLLAALVQKATLPGGAEQVLSLIRNQAPAAGGDILSQLPEILGSPQKRGDFEKKGGDLAGQILGPNLGAVIGALGGVLGLGKSVITPLLGMIAPLLMNIITKQVLSKGLGAQGLTDLLLSQTGFLKGALPAELTKSLGIDSLADLGTHAANAATGAAKQGTTAVKAAAQAPAPSGFPSWLIPLLGALAVGLLGLLLFRNFTATPPVAKTDVAVAEAPKVTTPAKPREAIVAVPDNPAIEIVEEVDIVDTALKSGSFKTLADLLQKAGLVETLKGDGPFTVFAPTDEAFSKVPGELLAELAKPENKEKLIEILKYHVVKGAVPAAQALGLDGKTVETIGGALAPIAVKDGKVTIGGANVTQGDVRSKNGVIHVIDAVLIPAK